MVEGEEMSKNRIDVGIGRENIQNIFSGMSPNLGSPTLAFSFSPLEWLKSTKQMTDNKPASVYKTKRLKVILRKLFDRARVRTKIAA